MKYGRYEVEKEIGRGGMATVYLARDPLTGRRVAVKVLHGTLQADLSFRQRFTREAEIIASLEHEAIVPLYDFGIDGQGPFLVFRHMEGGTLLARLARGPLSRTEVIEIVGRISRALDHAHSRRVVHRDVKPANILFDEEGRAFLGDFGVARLADVEGTLGPTSLVGTPSYMSPEQSEGRRATNRSDIYALACVTHEMLVRRPPFVADTIPQLLLMHSRAPIPSPAALGGATRAVVTALAKKPEDRFGTAAEFAAVLSKGLESSGDPVGRAHRSDPAALGTEPPRIVARSRGPVRRHASGRTKLLAASVFVAAGTLAAATVVGFARIVRSDGDVTSAAPAATSSAVAPGPSATQSESQTVAVPATTETKVERPRGLTFDAVSRGCPGAPKSEVAGIWQVSAPRSFGGRTYPGEAVQVGLRSKYGNFEETMHWISAVVVAPSNVSWRASGMLTSDNWLNFVMPSDFPGAVPLTTGIYTVIWESNGEFVACDGFEIG